MTMKTYIAHRCGRCGAANQIVNQCRCDPNNLPTTPGLSDEDCAERVVAAQQEAARADADFQGDATSMTMTSYHIAEHQAAKSTAEIIADAIRLDAETLAAGSRCTELRSVRDKTRRGSAQHTAAAEALFDAQASHAELERQRDSAWAVANSRRQCRQCS